MHINRRHLLALTFTVPVVAFMGQPSFAQSTPSIYAEDGIAIDGTDAVAYFTESKPVAGDPAITYDWMGATWRFASEANKAAFESNPAEYAPQFGGYCAWAVSQGYTASSTPKAWSIVDGKLYLNYSKRIQRRWEKDIPTHISQGTENWPKVLN